MDLPSPERWQRIEGLFDAALDLPAEERDAFLQKACGEDGELRREVMRLLDAVQDGDARLDTPAVNFAAPLLARTALESSLPMPKRIERYRLVREIGRGGMGTVYLAERSDYRHRVALKLVRRGLHLDENLVRRFRDERQILASLEHPNIARLLDGGLTEEALPYFVMEYVEGAPVDRFCDDRRLTIEDRLELFCQVCEAVEHAHARGIVHRDLKPPNILVSGEGRVKLLDFGVAKLLDPGAADEGLTLTGHRFMTPDYASPEQVRGEAVTPATDVYALGVLLYELLTGRRPYRLTSRTPHEIERAVLEQEPLRPSNAIQRLASEAGGEGAAVDLAEVARSRGTVLERLGRRLRGDLDAIVLKAMEKEPGRRYATAGELAADVRRHLDGLPVTAQADTWVYRTGKLVRRHRVRVAVGALVVLLLVLSSIATAIWMNRAAIEGAAPPAIGRAEKVTFEPGLELDPEISPDGRTLAYAAGPPSAMLIHLRGLGENRSGPVTPVSLAGARHPRWSPDGTRIAFQAKGSIWVMRAAGGAPHLLVEGEAAWPARWMAWSPDGSRIAYAQAEAIWVRDVEGGEPSRIAPVHEPHGLAWSPDGRWIAYVSGNPTFVVGEPVPSGIINIGNVAPSSIWIVPASGGEPRQMTSDEHLDVSPVWTPDGRAILFVSSRGGGRDVFGLPLDDEGRPSGSVSRLTTGLQAHSVSLSGDGRLLVYSSFPPTSNAYSIRIPRGEVLSSREAEPVTVGNQIVEGIFPSPDGKWLAFDSDRLGNPDIFKMALSGGEPVRLTTHPGGDFVPAWSPDGREIAYHSFQGPFRQIRIMSADGTNDRPAFPVAGHQNYPQWSPDGRNLTYHSWDTGEPHLFLLSRSDSGWRAPESLIEQPGEMARWSPDGRRIAFVDRTSLWILDVESREARPLFTSTDTAVEPAPVLPLWSEDGRLIYYKAFDARGQASIWSIPAEGGRPALLVRFDDPARQSSRLELASDGKRFYFTIGSLESDIWTLELEGELPTR